MSVTSRFSTISRKLKGSQAENGPEDSWATGSLRCHLSARGSKDSSPRREMSAGRAANDLGASSADGDSRPRPISQSRPWIRAPIFCPPVSPLPEVAKCQMAPKFGVPQKKLRCRFHFGARQSRVCEEAGQGIEILPVYTMDVHSSFSKSSSKPKPVPATGRNVALSAASHSEKCVFS